MVVAHHDTEVAIRLHLNDLVRGQQVHFFGVSVLTPELRRELQIVVHAETTGQGEVTWTDRRGVDRAGGSAMAACSSAAASTATESASLDGVSPEHSRVEIRRAGDRFVTVAEGRRTSHSFSFGPHYDPGNVGFGPLACHNDDRVEPGSGYDDHPHRDVEVVTWVLEGALSHRDSDGRAGVVVPGRVQAMSAGSGIVHAERVDPGAGPTRFIQTWVRPDEPGGDPSYAAADVEPGPEWTPVVSGEHPDAVPIGTRGATLWVARPVAGTELALPDVPRAHLFVARGAVALDVPGQRAADGAPPYDLAEADAARLTGLAGALRVDSPAELLLWTFG